MHFASSRETSRPKNRITSSPTTIISKLTTISSIIYHLELPTETNQIQITNGKLQITESVVCPLSSVICIPELSCKESAARGDGPKALTAKHMFRGPDPCCLF